MLLAVLAACAPLRRAPAPPAPSAPLLPSAPSAPLGSLETPDHERIDAWENRLRTHPQLRRATARRFGLVVNAHRDDRLAPERATRAAARYLHVLYEHYGDWPLALAAYNAGERRVDRALARDPEASFWRLAERGWLPRISSEYVPRFFAVVRVAGEHEPTAVGSAL